MLTLAIKIPGIENEIYDARFVVQAHKDRDKTLKIHILEQSDTGKDGKS